MSKFHEDILPFLDAIEKIAFDMRAPNSYTPRIIMALNAIKEIGDSRRSTSAGARPCTCHPADEPAVPCTGRYAYSECVGSADEAAHK